MTLRQLEQEVLQDRMQQIINHFDPMGVKCTNLEGLGKIKLTVINSNNLISRTRALSRSSIDNKTINTDQEALNFLVSGFRFNIFFRDENISSHKQDGLITKDINGDLIVDTVLLSESIPYHITNAQFEFIKDFMHRNRMLNNSTHPTYLSLNDEKLKISYTNWDSEKYIIEIGRLSTLLNDYNILYEQESTYDYFKVNAFDIYEVMRLLDAKWYNHAYLKAIQRKYLHQAVAVYEFNPNNKQRIYIANQSEEIMTKQQKDTSTSYKDMSDEEFFDSI